MYFVLVCLVHAVFSSEVLQSPDEEYAIPTPEIIRRDGYKCEVYHVTTADGYILGFQRIGSPNTALNPTKLPVLLQHGLLSTSAHWLTVGPTMSLAYLLADQGYDVWLGNARGTVYSRNHVNLSSSTLAFWDFSWHEMGYYDLPAVIDHILYVTDHRQILYVGHSMGTTMLYVMCTTRPEYNNKVRHMISLGPVAFLEYTTTPIRVLVPIAEEIALYMYIFTNGQFKTDSPPISTILELVCEQDSDIQERICSDITFLIGGVDPIGFNQTLIPEIIGQTKVNSASTKTLLHYAQLVRSGKFQQFDYGPIGNVRMYNSSSAPDYDLSLITVPLTLWYGENDLLGDPTDVKHLHTLLKNAKLKKVDFQLFNHLDFLFSKFVKDILYNDILIFFNSF